MGNKVTVQIEVDSKGAVTGVKNVGNELKQLEQDAKKTGQQFASSESVFGSLLKANILTQATNQVVNFGKESVQAYRDASSAALFLASSSKRAGQSLDEQRRIAAELAAELGLSVEQSQRAEAQALRLAGSLGRVGDAPKLVRALSDALAAAGRPASELSDAFQQLTTGQDELFDKIGGVGGAASPSALYEQFAKSVGRSVESLSDVEKTQIRVNAVLQIGAENAGAFADKLKTPAGKLDALEARVGDLKSGFGEALLTAPATQQLLTSLERLLVAYQDLRTKGIDPLSSALFPYLDLMRQELDITERLAKYTRGRSYSAANAVLSFFGFEPQYGDFTVSGSQNIPNFAKAGGGLQGTARSTKRPDYSRTGFRPGVGFSGLFGKEVTAEDPTSRIEALAAGVGSISDLGGRIAELTRQRFVPGEPSEADLRALAIQYPNATPDDLVRIGKAQSGRLGYGAESDSERIDRILGDSGRITALVNQAGGALDPETRRKLAKRLSSEAIVSGLSGYDAGTFTESQRVKYLEAAQAAQQAAVEREVEQLAELKKGNATLEALRDLFHNGKGAEAEVLVRSEVENSTIQKQVADVVDLSKYTTTVDGIPTLNLFE